MNQADSNGVDPIRSEGEYEVKRDHHYLPASYLKGFCDTNGKVWEFNREFPKYRDRGPRSTGFREYLYTITDAAGNKLNDVEDSFTDHENELPGIRSLIEDGQPIDSETWLRLIQFSAAMFVRVESTVGAMSNVAKASALGYVADNLASEDQARKTVAKLFGDPTSAQRMSTEAIQKLMDAAIAHGHSNNLAMDLMQRKRMESEGLLSKKNLTVYFAPPGESFITTDRPFLPVRIDHTTRGLKGAMGRGTKCVVPFSKKVMLVFHDEPGVKITKADISRDELNHRNSRIAYFSWRLIFGGSHQQLRSIVEENRLAEVDPEPTFLTQR